MKTALKWLIVVMLAFVAGMVFSGHMLRQYREEQRKAQDRRERLPEAEAFTKNVLARMGLHTDIWVVRGGRWTCGWANSRFNIITLGERCNELYRAGKIDWRVAGVLCHEIGHILNRHEGMKGVLEWASPEQVEADEFAGFAMKMMGATLDEALSGYQGMEENANREAVKRGWRR